MYSGQFYDSLQCSGFDNLGTYHEAMQKSIMERRGNTLTISISIWGSITHVLRVGASKEMYQCPLLMKRLSKIRQNLHNDNVKELYEDTSSQFMDNAVRKTLKLIDKISETELKCLKKFVNKED